MSSVDQDECNFSSEGDQTNTSDDSDKKKQSSQGNQMTEDAREQKPPPLAVAQQCTQGGNSSTVSKETRHEELGTSSRPKKISLPSLSKLCGPERYRQGYPGKEDDPSINHNFEFYTNKRPSDPGGDLIDSIHKNWWGNYQLLEDHHSYIQWLFPIRETSRFNPCAKELQPHEIKQICEDPKALERVIKSYEMMLDFYGLKLEDKSSGDVKRSQDYSQRFDNLNNRSHNNWRITRILKCMGEFGLEHFKVPLIKHLLHEAIIERTLLNTLNSCVNYWIAVVKDDKQREELYKHAKELVEQANQET